MEGMTPSTFHPNGKSQFAKIAPANLGNMEEISFHLRITAFLPTKKWKVEGGNQIYRHISVSILVFLQKPYQSHHFGYHSDPRNVSSRKLRDRSFCTLRYGGIRRNFLWY